MSQNKYVQLLWSKFSVGHFQIFNNIKTVGFVFLHIVIKSYRLLKYFYYWSRVLGPHCTLHHFPKTFICVAYHFSRENTANVKYKLTF